MIPHLAVKGVVLMWSLYSKERFCLAVDPVRHFCSILVTRFPHLPCCKLSRVGHMVASLFFECWSTTIKVERVVRIFQRAVEQVPLYAYAR